MMMHAKLSGVKAGRELKIPKMVPKEGKSLPKSDGIEQTGISKMTDTWLLIPPMHQGSAAVTRRQDRATTPNMPSRWS
jgi:hypothetical protein